MRWMTVNNQTHWAFTRYMSNEVIRDPAIEQLLSHPTTRWFPKIRFHTTCKWIVGEPLSWEDVHGGNDCSSRFGMQRETTLITIPNPWWMIIEIIFQYKLLEIWVPIIKYLRSGCTSSACLSGKGVFFPCLIENLFNDFTDLCACLAISNFRHLNYPLDQFSLKIFSNNRIWSWSWSQFLLFVSDNDAKYFLEYHIYQQLFSQTKIHPGPLQWHLLSIKSFHLDVYFYTVAYLFSV